MRSARTPPRAKTLLGAISLALALLCAFLGAAGTADAAAKARPLYWGAWIGDQLTGEQPPWDMSAVTQFESHVHKGLSLLEFSSPFSDCSEDPCSYYPFPAAQMQSVRDYGAIPFFSWNSASSSGAVEDPDFQLADIVGGAYDGYIREWATAARDWGHPFFLRFNWEMNGRWFPWSEGVNGNQPGEYVAAWRHVHDIFSGVGASNASWVWCPYADPGRLLSRIGRFYPGSAYVNWTCLDGFNWGRNDVNPLPWRSFDTIFAKPYRQIVRRIAPNKPMILAEVASGGNGRSKAAWLRGMFKRLATKYRRIRGLIWFDQVDRGVQWPLEGSPAVSRAFVRGLRTHPFRGNRFATLDGNPIAPPG